MQKTYQQTINMSNNTVLSVSQLLTTLQSLLNVTNTRRQKIYGEIGAFKQYPSGHCYFTLKDNDSMIQAVLFKTQYAELESRSEANLGILLREGMNVEIEAELNIYKPRGQLQIICKHIRALGQGSILQLLEARKKKFAALGYFDEERKKAITPFCFEIGIVTSRETAALQDVIKIFSQASIKVRLHIFDTAVQGQGAGKLIAAQIQKANRYPLDCILVCRGGGATEDLLCFSDEIVLDAIYESHIPVISGVGHQIDMPLCDLVADVRTPTPTAAASFVVETLASTHRTIMSHIQGLRARGQGFVNDIKLRLQILNPRSAIGSLLQTIKNKKQYLDHMQETFTHCLRQHIKQNRSRLEFIQSYLLETEPCQILKKGYALVHDPKKTQLITRRTMTKDKIHMVLEFWDGELTVVKKPLP